MSKIRFRFNGKETLIESSKEEKIKDILDKFLTKNNISKNKNYSSYLENKIDLESSFNDLFDVIHKEESELTISIKEEENKHIKYSNDIICPECKENCLINMTDYKINLYGCKNGHEYNNISLSEFYQTQTMNEKDIICNKCSQNNKFESLNKEFYICLTCKKNLCKECFKSHERNHHIIDYDKKNYICEKHHNTYISFCEKCQMNLCYLCESEHIECIKIDYQNFLFNEEEIEQIKESLKKFRIKVDILNNFINFLIKELEKIKENIEVYYKINYNLINNYQKEYINYQNLENIKYIKNNLFANYFNEIISNNRIMKKIQYLYNIYKKMKNKKINDEITIIYKKDKEDDTVKILGEEFVKNYKDKCFIRFNNQEITLIENKNIPQSERNKDILEIQLTGISQITDASHMFEGCVTLISLPDISFWDTINVTNMSYMFKDCIMLSYIGNISKWNTDKVTNMKYMFLNCNSFFSRNTLTNLSNNFKKDNSESSIPASNYNSSSNKNNKQIIILVFIVKNTKNIILYVDHDDNIENVKNKIQIKEGFPINKQILSFSDAYLENDKTVSYYNIVNGSYIELNIIEQFQVNFFDIENNTKFKVVVSSNDTIKKVKKNIDFIEKPENINLTFNSHILENYKTLFNYNIKEDSTIYVIRIAQPIINKKIYIKTYKGENIEFDYEKKQTIESLKIQIQEKEKFPINQIKILFNGKDLENDKTLSYYNIEAEETLNLKINIEIFIKYKEKIIKLIVEPYNSIENIKRRIMDIEGFPIDAQKLMFNNKELEDAKNISEYEIGNGSYIDLIILENKIKNIIKVYIKLNGKKTDFDFEQGEYLENVKLKILDKIGIPVNQQNLIFKGKILKENKPLFKYNIRDTDTIFLFQTK